MIEEARADVVVVGSGFGGAVAACRLAQAGLRVLIIERGRRFDPGDFPSLGSHAALLPDLRRWSWQGDQGLWDIQDLEEIISVQAAAYGGGSTVYGNVHLRPPSGVFDDDWPEIYRGGQLLDPFYDLAAHMLDVAPVTESPHFPSLVKADQLKKAVTQLGRGDDDAFFHPPLAITYEKREGNEHRASQPGCTFCGACCSGCRVGAKNTLDRNYLADAERNGAKVMTQCEVIDLYELEDGTWRLECMDHLRAERISIHAPDLFLCAGAIHSTRLLARAHLQPQSREARSRLGFGYFPDAGAIAMVYDTEHEQLPSWGPVITTTLVHWAESAERAGSLPPYFVIQDGGYAVELARLLGLFRAPLWAGRNRLTYAGKADVEPSTLAARPAVAGAAGTAVQPSALDALLDAIEQGDFRGVLPEGFRIAWPQFLRELKEPLLLASIVQRTVESAMRARLESSWLTKWMPANHPLRRALQWTGKLLIRVGFGPDQLIADHAMRGIFSAAGLDRRQIVKKVLGYTDEGAARRVMLLAIGRDRTPGILLYDRRRDKMIADLDLYHLAPMYLDQQRLMSDIAKTLGGELRVNPAGTFLGKPITVHSAGGCRMSDDPSLGVTNPDGRVHRCAHLYVLDAAILCRSVGVNPSATILAIAERNILEFIRERTGTHWPEGIDSSGAVEYRRQRANARLWAERATAREWTIRLPRAREVPLATEAIGISFHESMQGFYSSTDQDPQQQDELYRRLETLGRVETADTPVLSLELDLQLSTKSLATFFEDERHTLQVTGTVRMARPGAAPPEPLPATGTVELMVARFKPYGLRQSEARTAQRRIVGKEYKTRVGAPGEGDDRFMNYTLDFKVNGESWRLEGYKRIASSAAIHAWRDTTSLFVKLLGPAPGSSDEVGARDERPLAVRGAGVVHLDLTSFLTRQLPSIQVSGVAVNPETDKPDPARTSWAIAKFAAFFFGTLQRIYVPEAAPMLRTFFARESNNLRFEARSERG